MPSFIDAQYGKSVLPQWHYVGVFHRKELQASNAENAINQKPELSPEAWAARSLMHE